MTNNEQSRLVEFIESHKHIEEIAGSGIGDEVVYINELLEFLRSEND